MNNNPQCTCPSVYTDRGLVKHGTDYKCRVHGPLAQPSEVEQMRDLLERANGTLIGYIQELEKAPMTTLNHGRDVVRRICAKLGTPNPLEN